MQLRSATCMGCPSEPLDPTPAVIIDDNTHLHIYMYIIIHM